MTPSKTLVKSCLQVATEHGRNTTCLLEDCHPLGQLSGSIPTTEQCSISGKGTGFKQANEESEGVKLQSDLLVPSLYRGITAASYRLHVLGRCHSHHENRP